MARFDSWIAAADSCRAQGRDEDALRILREAWSAAGRVPDLAAWRRTDLAARIATCEAVLALHPERRTELARADSLRTLLAGFACRDCRQACDLASEEARLRERVLGPFHLETGESLGRLARCLRRKGDYLSAEEAGLRGESILLSTVGEDHPATAENLVEQAVLLRLKRQFVSARDRSARAVEIYRRTGGDESVRYALALTVHAGAVRDMGLAAEARPMYDEALRITARPGVNPLDRAEALFTSGVCHMRLRDFPRAEASIRRALEITRDEPGHDPLQVAWMLHDLATSVLEQRRLDEAAACFREALSIRKAETGATCPLIVEDLRILTSIAQTQGRWAEAESLLTEAVAIYEKVRLRAGVGIVRDLFYISPYDQLAVNLLMQGRQREAWRPAEMAQGRSLSDLLFDLERRSLTDGQAAREGALARTLVRLEDSLSALPAGESPRRYALLSQLAATEAAWLSFEAEVLRDRPYPGKASIEDLREALGPRAALIGWVAAPVFDDRSAIVFAYAAASDGRFHWSRLDWGANAAQVYEDTRRFSKMLQQAAAWPSHVADDPRMQTGGQLLWRHWLAPLERHLHGIERLIVLPGEVVMRLPIELMVDSTGVWLGDRFEISYIPSAALLAHLMAAQPRRETDFSHASALLIADPLRSPADSCRGYQETPAEDSGPRGSDPLPGARLEVERVARCFDRASVIAGAEASESRLRRMAGSGELRTFDVLHFATHTRIDAGRPDQSALLLAREPETGADGVLTAREVARDLRLDSDLVCLSGCSSGLGREVDGEGFLGLSSAFLLAGARSLVISLWDVEDEATVAFMDGFYRRLQAGEGRREALAQARRDLRETVDADGRRPFAHPVYWAGFVLVGDPR